MMDHGEWFANAGTLCRFLEHRFPGEKVYVGMRQHSDEWFANVGNRSERFRMIDFQRDAHAAFSELVRKLSVAPVDASFFERVRMRKGKKRRYLRMGRRQWSVCLIVLR